MLMNLLVRCVKQSKYPLVFATILTLVCLSAENSASQQWNQLAPTGGPPSARSYPSTIFDTATNQMIVFGGGDSSPSSHNLFNDTWSLKVSGSGQWTQLSPSGSVPQARQGQTAVYDSANSRMIVFGGALGFTSPCSNETWVLSDANSVAGTPAWTKLSPTGSLPPGRLWHTAIYDPGSNRMIVFGGNNCSSDSISDDFNDAWVLTNANGLGGVPAWTQLTPTGAPPPARANLGAFYDAASNRMTVFGGFSAAGVLYNDTWVLSNANGLGGTPTWTQLTPSGTPPSPRDDFATVDDPSSNLMIIFGGGDITGDDLNEVWVLSDANGLGSPAWTLLDPSGTPPSERGGSAAVFDPALNGIVVFGGEQYLVGVAARPSYNDTWTLTATTPIVTVAPSPSSITTAQALTVTVAVSGTPAPTGSVNLTSGTFKSAATALSSGGATIIIPAGSLAVGSDTLAAVYTPDSSSSISYNRATGSSSVMVTTVPSLTPTVTVTPTSTNITTAQSLTVLIGVSGGSGNPTPTGSITLTGGGYTSAAATLGSGSATINVPAGSLAVGGVALTASYEPDGSSSSIYNGASGTSPTVTVTQATTTPQEWNQLAPGGGPPGGRADASAIFDDATSQMIIFGGGVDSTSNLNDTWSLQVIGSLQWKQLSTSGTPPQARRGHTAAYDSANSRMIIFGGGFGYTSPCANDTWVLSNANSVAGTPTWTELSPTGGPPAPRIFAAAGYDPGSNRMVVFGGNNCFGGDISDTFNDVWVLTNANGLGGAPVWTQLTPTGATPPVRENFGSTYDAASNRMTIFGGWSGTGVFYNDVWVLSNANGLGGSPTWTQLTPSGVLPSPRAAFATAADPESNRILIFDGGNSDYDLNEVWVLSNANGLGSPAWTLLDPSGTPPSARDSFTAVYDHSSNEYVIFGGEPDTELTVYSDTWTLTATTPTVTVTPSASSITTAQALTVTVAVSGTDNLPPTGSVTLNSGTFVSAAAALSSGGATISIPAGSLAIGSDQIAAVYTPDSSSSINYNSATGSSSVTITTAVNPSFTISGTAVTVTPGASTGNTSTITVSPAGGFTGAVALTAAITSSPTGAQYPPTLSFGSTTPVSITGTTAGTATLTISTTAATSAAMVDPKTRGIPWFATSGAALACTLLFGFPARRRKWQMMVAMLLFLLIITNCASACGGSSGGHGNPGTTSGAYTITVTATSGTTTATGTIALDVQ